MNGIYETMLHRHNLDNDDARRNAHYEVSSRLFWEVYIEEDSLRKPPSTEEHA